jgi:dTDP-4-dehydrorhamnose 3,5-epimerase-like enzyme
VKPRCLSIPEVTLFVPMVFRADQRILSENAGQHVFEELETGAVQCNQENHSGSSRTVSNSFRNKVDNSNKALARVARASNLNFADDLCISPPLRETFISVLLRGNNHIQQWALQGLINMLFVVSALAGCMKKSFYYNSEFEPFFKWTYSDLPINWRFNEAMAVRSTLSAKKLSTPTFEDAEKPS